VHFDHLEIFCFRNLDSVALELNPGLNFFHGDNGAGKTAILEAAHLLVRGRSFRGHRPKELIQRGQEQLTVRATLADQFLGPRTIAMTRELSGRTELKINGLQETRLSEVARLIPLQIMLPNVADLVFGGPGVRRRWLDWGTFHVKPDYLRVQREYVRLLRQRNAALKAGITSSPDFEAWTAQLVQAAERVDAYRKTHIDELRPLFSDVLSALAPELDVELVYVRGWSAEEPLDKVLGGWGSREVKLGATQAGPHRADVDLRVGDARAAGLLSRGQAKAVASAMMVSQARLLAGALNQTSVFLIDDVGAELDEGHNARFFQLLDDMDSQILATSTLLPRGGSGFAGKRMTVFHVEHGRVQRSLND
jgi:DNA replication and repair protein RecF